MNKNLLYIVLIAIACFFFLPLAFADSITDYTSAYNFNLNIYDVNGFNNFNNVGGVTYAPGKIQNGTLYAPNAYLNSNQTTNIDFSGSSSASMWVYVNAVGSATDCNGGAASTVIFAGAKISNNVIVILCYQNISGTTNLVVNRLKQNTANQQIKYPVNFGIGSSSWQQVGYTYNASASNLSLYLNGTLVGSMTTSGNGASGVVKQNVTLGATFDTAGNAGGYWSGGIDSVYVFNRTLSPSEMSLLYNGGAGVEAGVSTSSSLKITANNIYTGTALGAITAVVNGTTYTNASGNIIYTNFSQSPASYLVNITLNSSADGGYFNQSMVNYNSSADLTVTMSQSAITFQALDSTTGAIISGATFNTSVLTNTTHYFNNQNRNVTAQASGWYANTIQYNVTPLTIATQNIALYNTQFNVTAVNTTAGAVNNYSITITSGAFTQTINTTSQNVTFNVSQYVLYNVTATPLQGSYGVNTTLNWNATQLLNLTFYPFVISANVTFNATDFYTGQALQNITVVIQNQACNQTNVSLTTCGQSVGGSFGASTADGNLLNPAYFANDGNYATYSGATSGTPTAFFYWNYSRPKDAVTAYWMIGLGTGTALYNLSIPYGCMNGTTVQLRAVSLYPSTAYAECNLAGTWVNVTGITGSPNAAVRDQQIYWNAPSLNYSTTTGNLTLPILANTTALFNFTFTSADNGGYFNRTYTNFNMSVVTANVSLTQSVDNFYAYEKITNIAIPSAVASTAYLSNNVTHYMRAQSYTVTGSATGYYSNAQQYTATALATQNYNFTLYDTLLNITAQDLFTGWYIETATYTVSNAQYNFTEQQTAVSNATFQLVKDITYNISFDNATGISSNGTSFAIVNVTGTTSNGANASDRDWTTYSTAVRSGSPFVGTSSYYWNYTLPITNRSIINMTWHVKDGKSEWYLTNVSTACLNQNTVRFRADSDITIFPEYSVTWYCYNGASWVPQQKDFDYISDAARVYEQELILENGYPFYNATILNYNLASGNINVSTGQSTVSFVAYEKVTGVQLPSVSFNNSFITNTTQYMYIDSYNTTAVKAGYRQSTQLVTPVSLMNTTVNYTLYNMTLNISLQNAISFAAINNFTVNITSPNYPGFFETQNSSNGYVFFNLTTGNYTLSIYANGFYYYTANYAYTGDTNVTYGLVALGSLQVRYIRTDTGALITGVNSTLIVQNTTQSVTYTIQNGQGNITGLSPNNYIMICQTPGFANNTFTLVYDFTNTPSTFTCYMNPTASQITFQVQSSDLTPLPGVLVSATQFVNGTPQIVTQGITDGTGTTVLGLITGQTTTITLSKSGYLTQTSTNGLTQTVYTYTLSPINRYAPNNVPNTGIVYSFSPTQYDLNRSNYNFVLNVTATNDSLLDFFRVSLYDENNTLLSSINDSVQPLGGTLVLPYDLTGYGGSSVTAVFTFQKTGYPSWSAPIVYHVGANFYTGSTSEVRAWAQTHFTLGERIFLWIFITVCSALILYAFGIRDLLNVFAVVVIAYGLAWVFSLNLLLVSLIVFVIILAVLRYTI